MQKKETIFVAPRFPELLITMEPNRYADARGNRVQSRHMRFFRGPKNWGVFKTSDAAEIKHLKANPEFVANTNPDPESEDSGIFEVDQDFLDELTRIANKSKRGMVVRGALTSAIAMPQAPAQAPAQAPTTLKVPARRAGRK